MFWGTIVKDAKPYNAQQALEKSEYQVLHISNVALPRDAKANSKVTLLVSMGKDLKDLTIATLTKDKVEVVALDLYINISQAVSFSTVGGDLHLSGFFEPQREEMDENMFFDGEEDEEEEGEDEVSGNLKTAKQNAMKNSTLNAKSAKQVLPESESDLDEEDELEDDDDEEDEDEEEEYNKMLAAKKAQAAILQKSKDVKVSSKPAVPQ
jgi:hypothetical protein